MMEENMEMQDKQSDQNLDPNRTIESDQYPSQDISSNEAGQLKGMSLHSNTSSNPNAIQSSPASTEEKAMAAENVNPNEMPNAPKSVSEAEQPWFNREDLDDLHRRWTSIQVQFVDEPCAAVEQAEAMVVETIERVKQMISDQQQSLDNQWLNHDDISTEELRITMQNYRSLLNRLLKL
jgi:hypothetical protein